MGKKPRAKKIDTAKNPDLTSETPNNGFNHREPEPVVSNKPSKNQILCVRRSGRLQSLIKPVQNQEVEEIDLVESEREEEEDGPQFEENVEFPLRNGGPRDGPTTNERAEDVIRAVEVLRSKVGDQGNGFCESPSVGLIYKSLYLDSQKKIEALTSENHELTRKLEIVLGKLEVYEEINKSQTVIISNMEKAIEALVRSASSVGGDAGGSIGGGRGNVGNGGGSGGGGGVVPRGCDAGGSIGGGRGNVGNGGGSGGGGGVVPRGCDAGGSIGDAGGNVGNGGGSGGGGGVVPRGSSAKKRRQVSFANI